MEIISKSSYSIVLYMCKRLNKNKLFSWIYAQLYLTFRMALVYSYAIHNAAL